MDLSPLVTEIHTKRNGVIDASGRAIHAARAERRNDSRKLPAVTRPHEGSAMRSRVPAMPIDARRARSEPQRHPWALLRMLSRAEAHGCLHALNLSLGMEGSEVPDRGPEGARLDVVEGSA